MSTRVAQEITRLLADESEGRPSATRRRAKARLVASIAEGLDRAQIADLRAGLSDGARAAFFDARLSPAERDIVITALSHDPRERAEMSSAAALLDCVDAEPIPLPTGLLAQAAMTFAVANSAAQQGAVVGGQRAWRRRAPLAVGVSLAALVLVVGAVGGLPSPGGQEMLAPSVEPTRPAQATAETATKASDSSATGQPAGRAILPPADNRSTKAQPRSDGPTPRTASSRQSSAFRVGMVVEGLSVIPDGLFEIARQLGKDLVDGECLVVHHPIDALRSRGILSSTSRSRSRESLSRMCAKHSPFTTAYQATELDGPGPRKPAHASYAEELPPRPGLEPARHN